LYGLFFILGLESLALPPLAYYGLHQQQATKTSVGSQAISQAISHD
jgi:hypothetical protein